MLSYEYNIEDELAVRGEQRERKGREELAAELLDLISKGKDPKEYLQIIANGGSVPS